MSPKASRPAPIFDNLEYLSNPFQTKKFETSPFFHNCAAPAWSKVDYEYAWKFIYSYNGSSATFNVYRREIERVIQWSWHINGCSVVALKREDIEAYVQFCIKPPPSWIGTKNVARFKNLDGNRLINSDWHPFVATVRKSDRNNGNRPEKHDFVLSQASIQAIFAVLSSFFNFLIQEQLTEANPVSLIRQKSKFLRKSQHKAPIRRISNLQWDYVIETVEELARAEPEIHERSLFVMNCLLGMYLRISELVADERATPVMGDFRKDVDGNWWFHVTGKGNKSRVVTVCNDMLEALKRYRTFLGLSPLPSVGDQTPLVPKHLGRGPIASTRQVRAIVQVCFDRSYARMKSDGLVADAGDLRVATAHWLRHTAISEDVKVRPREHVRDDAGHSSMQTTDRYIDSDSRERHASGKKKQIKGHL